MIRSSTQITATGTGPTNYITLTEGLWNIFINSSGWGTATLEVSHNGTDWFTVQEDGSNLSLTANTVKELNGGLLLRINVSSFSQAINLVAKKSS